MRRSSASSPTGASRWCDSSPQRHRAAPSSSAGNGSSDVQERRAKTITKASIIVDCGEGLLGIGRRPGSLVARWCSGLARVENNDPANDGLWTPKPGKRPIDGSSNLPRATRTLARRREYAVRIVEDALCKKLRKLSRLDSVPV